MYAGGPYFPLICIRNLPRSWLCNLIIHRFLNYNYKCLNYNCNCRLITHNYSYRFVTCNYNYGFVNYNSRFVNYNSRFVNYNSRFVIYFLQQQTTGYTSEHRGKQSSPSENMNEGRDKKRSIGEAGDFNFLSIALICIHD